MRNEETLMEAVRELRTALKMNPTIFAVRLGVSPATIYRWESTYPPKGPALSALAELAQSAQRPDLHDIFKMALSQAPDAAAPSDDHDHSDPKRKKITVFLDPDLHERLVVSALRRGTKLQGALVAAAELWLRPDAPTSPTTPSPYEDSPSVDRLYHELLHLILSEGSERDRVGIQANLEWAVTSIRQRATASHSEKAG